MPKQRRRPKQELDSLIPAIKSEEKHLEDLLAEARVRVDGIIRDAEAQAAERIKAAQLALPGVLEAGRRSRHAAVESMAAEAAREETQKTRDLEHRARASMDATVRYIVSLVWPGAAQDPPSVHER